MTPIKPTPDANHRLFGIFSFRNRADRPTKITASKNMIAIAFAKGMNFIDPQKQAVHAKRSNPRVVCNTGFSVMKAFDPCRHRAKGAITAKWKKNLAFYIKAEFFLHQI